MHLLIRRSKEYYEQGILTYKTMTATLERHDLVVRRIKQFEDYFKIDYIQARRMIRNVAEDFNKQPKFESTIKWRDEKIINALPNGSWLLPIDEDDWIHPNAPEILDKANKPDAIITWNVIKKRVDGRVLAPAEVRKGSVFKGNFVSESCGFAARMPCGIQTLMNHTNVIMDAQKHLTEVLSIRNQSITSLSYLWDSKSFDQIIADFNQSLGSKFSLPEHFRNAWTNTQGALAALEAGRH